MFDRPSFCRAPDGTGSVPMPERFAGIRRDYTPADVAKLAGSFQIRHTLAEKGAERLWHLLHSEAYVATLGALTGNQALQQVKAGLQAIYLSGWQVAADANTASTMYPDQSLYPVNSVPEVVKRINNALRRADQVAHLEAQSGAAHDDTNWMAPIVADAEAGFGGALNAYELMRAMIDAGAAGVHFEDQLSSEKKCGHLGGKVLVPISQHIRTLNAARLAADVEGVSTILLCRTDAESAQLLTADVDERDRPFITGERTPEGFHRIKPGVGKDYAIARGLAYAPYSDLLWWETSDPDLGDARRFAEAIHREFPGKLLAYNCSPARDRRHGLPVPVHHPGRLPQPQPRHVRTRPRLQSARNGRVFGAATGRIRVRAERLHRHPSPAGGGRQLLRRHRDGSLGRPEQHHRDGQQHRDSPVPRRRRALILNQRRTTS